MPQTPWELLFIGSGAGVVLLFFFFLLQETAKLNRPRKLRGEKLA